MEIRITSLAVILAVLCEVLTENKPEQSTSVFPDRRKAPGIKSPKKCWWTKEITPDLHVAGRPTERQIKYAAEAGFKTILSLFTYPDSEPRQTFGGDPLPNTAEAQKIVEEIAGLKFITLLDPMDEWASVEAVEKLTQAMPSLPKPILLHCDRGYTISFVTLMYLANQTRRDPSFKPSITSDDFYNISAAMGLDFISRIPQEVVSEITGEPVPTNPTRPNTVPEDWMDYWVAHPVYKNWYTAGQITRSHLPVMVEVGYKSVVNLRSGITLDGKPNQEEVNLLNIKDATGTYAKGDREPRQWKARLEETRINPNRPNHFISPESKVNYESNNTEEFGDEVGFQETTERVAFLKSPLEYYHMPLDSKRPMYGVFLAAEMSKLLEISEKGPVLVHCASGKRAAYVAVLAAAVQYDMDFDWAARRINELGFELSKDKMPEIYRTYINWLVTRRQPKDEL